MIQNSHFVDEEIRGNFTPVCHETLSSKKEELVRLLDTSVYHDQLVRSILENPKQAEWFAKRYGLSLSGLVKLDISQVFIPLRNRRFPADFVLAKLQHPEKKYLKASWSPEENELLKRFEVLFGRDALNSSLVLIEENPEDPPYERTPEDVYQPFSIALGALIELARWQALHANKYGDADKGKIPHEVREENDPIRRLLKKTRNYSSPYYGGDDQTMLWLKLLARLYTFKQKYQKVLIQHPEYQKTFMKNGKDQLETLQSYLNLSFKHFSGSERTLGMAQEDAVQWIVKKLHQGKGLFISFKKNPKGIGNPCAHDGDYTQVYRRRTSHSSKIRTVLDVKYANPAHKKAILSIQALAYDALLLTAALYDELGQAKRASSLRKRAAKLKKRIHHDFWVRDRTFGGYYAMALEFLNGSVEKVDACGSDQIHLFDFFFDETIPVDKKRMMQVIRRLTREDMFRAAGLLQLTADETGYGVHFGNGSIVVPFENYLFAQRLKHRRLFALALQIEWRLMEVFRRFGDIEFLSTARSERAQIDSRRLTATYGDGRSFDLTVPAQVVQLWSYVSHRKLEERFKHVQDKDVLPQPDDIELREFEKEIVGELHSRIEDKYFREQYGLTESDLVNPTFLREKVWKHTTYSSAYILSGTATVPSREEVPEKIPDPFSKESLLARSIMFHPPDEGSKNYETYKQYADKIRVALYLQRGAPESERYKRRVSETVQIIMEQFKYILVLVSERTAESRIAQFVGMAAAIQDIISKEAEKLTTQLLKKKLRDRLNTDVLRELAIELEVRSFEYSHGLTSMEHGDGPITVKELHKYALTLAQLRDVVVEIVRYLAGRKATNKQELVLVSGI